MDGVAIDLPQRYLYHAFISYKQSSGKALARRVHNDLISKKYNVWWDQNTDDELITENMMKGVEQSIVLILILSEDVFKSIPVQREIQKALKVGHPILLAHDPDTDKYGHCKFGDYIDACPEELRVIFDNSESKVLFDKQALLDISINALETSIRTQLDKIKK